MFNGKQYASGAGTPGGGGDPGQDAAHLKIAWEEYRALEVAGTVDMGAVYFIRDVPDEGMLPPEGSVTVGSVEVHPGSVSVQKGTSQIFGAAVMAPGNEGYVPQTVTWAVTGGEAAGTRINGAGVLSVAADETAEALTVTATPVRDPSKSGSAAVTVVSSAATPGLTGITLVPGIVEVQRGKVQAFRAYLDASGNVSRALEWEVSGGVSSGTYITDTGLLRVAPDETTSSLSVTVSSAATGVSASAIAYVTDAGDTALDLLLELKEDKANRGKAGGYAPLGTDSKVPYAFLPDTDTKFLGMFASEAHLHSVYPDGSPAIESGDYAFVTITGSQVLYIYDGAAWEAQDAIGTGIPSGMFVEKVNGKAGPNVNLGYSDVGAAPAGHATDWSMHMTAAEKAKLAGLEPNMTFVETPYPATSAVSFAYAKLVKIGRLCFILGEVMVNSALGAETTIISSVPASFAADTNKLFYSYFPLSNSGEGNATFVGFSIKPNRSISVIGMDPGQLGVQAKNIPAGSWFHMNAVWLSV
jgi:hypothetical protein